jgi:ABC-type multidrug transport system fused ATPase/permease subunit
MGFTSCIRHVFDLLDRRERIRTIVLLGMIIFMAFLELLGVALILPFISLLSQPDSIQDRQYFKYIYEFFSFSSPRAFLITLGIVVFLQIVLANSFKAYTTSRILQFSYGLGHSISSRLLRSYMSRPYEWFLTQNSANLSKIMLSEVNQVVNRTILPLLQICSQGILAFAIFSFLIAVDPVLALATVCILGASFCVIYYLLRQYILRMASLRLEANQRRFQIAQEVLGGIKDVKAVCGESVFLKRFDESSRLYAACEANNQVAGQLPRYALEAIGFGGIIVLAMHLFITHEGLNGALDLLVLYAVAGYRLLPTLQHIFQNVSSVRFSVPSLEALHKNVTETLSSLLLSEDTPPTRMKLTEAIALRDVYYTYPSSGKPSLHGINVYIRAHSFVAFVGPTGSGKTTVIDILLGLLTPSQGEMLVDGLPVDETTQRAWRRNVGYVPQHIFLADDTIEANIAFGVPQLQIDRDAVIRAAKTAHMHDFILQELDDGYETYVGERGVRLSGGQRQRIGIARALYHDPDVLILDEATSALDSATEGKVMLAIQALGRSKTIIVIAHRLTTVKDCDEIYVLSGARAINSGTYDELLERCEKFRALALQA